jgi:hypothetical protein
MANLPMQSAGGKAQPSCRAKIGYGGFQAVQSIGDAGFLLGEGGAFRERIRHHGQAFRRGIG